MASRLSALFPKLFNAQLIVRREAVFFLATNVLIVFGLVAFDNALAILQTFPGLFDRAPILPPPQLLISALLSSTAKYDKERLEAFRDAIDRLRKKSRSFYLASGVFQGRLRHDLVLLYSFCRVADDLVDTASTLQEARDSIYLLRSFLDSRFRAGPNGSNSSQLQTLLKTLPRSSQLVLQFLPTYLSPEPFYDLLRGFEMDLDFNPTTFPIKDKHALATYGERVAGTVAELIIQSAFHHYDTSGTEIDRQEVFQAGRLMGVALQIVNIARDIAVDAAIGRVYIPTAWLNEAGLEPQDVIKDPQRAEVKALREGLLAYSMEIYQLAMPKIEMLPAEARRPMRVAVESYMEIGRVLLEPHYTVKAGRATVPKARRIRVAWRALCT